MAKYPCKKKFWLFAIRIKSLGVLRSSEWVSEPLESLFYYKCWLSQHRVDCLWSQAAIQTARQTQWPRCLIVIVTVPIAWRHVSTAVHFDLHWWRKCWPLERVSCLGKMAMAAVYTVLYQQCVQKQPSKMDKISNWWTVLFIFDIFSGNSRENNQQLNNQIAMPVI